MTARRSDLEQSQAQTSHWVGRYEAEKETVERLRGALRFYADPKTYEQTGWNDDWFVILDDRGAAARSALGEKS